ncbi:unnamed protein product [Arctia plantaginis]|uniref:Disks large-associated protein 5 n=1 Tax=Arctia plantaginis TaxID=874455 RepID=A0A8S0YRM1_ARCPL|nr:unnamed protein product [Arctia plantaginis]
MEESFDLGRLLRNHQKVHKSKPSQFGSVAGGVKKRFENNLKHRKSNRLSCFDNVRDLSRGESPVPPPKVQSKEEHRRQQLEKWKEQKEKQKKEAAAQKKKPFVAGVPHAPLKFIPPPPIQKPKPSTSGRVTRSQSAKVDTKSRESKTSNSSQSSSKSFAPKNASFRPPEIKNVTTLPKLAPIKTKKDKKHNITFDPIMPNVQKENKQSRTKALRHGAVDTLPAQKQAERKTKAKGNKSSPKKNKLVKATLQSISSSEKEQSDNVSPILKIRSSRKSMAAPKSATIVTKTPRKSMQIEPQPFTPKNPVPKSESSSEERLRSPKSENAGMTPEQIAEEAKNISPCVTISRGKDNARKEMKKKLNEGLLDEDASDMGSVDHFRKQLASEIKRMTEMCETWEKISQQNILPETVQEAALSAVGQARLLMSQKLQQFAALVEACARPEPGRALVTPADLHGFWDMVFMQIENVDIRFNNLEELRARGWVEVVEPVAIKKKVVKNPVKKVTKPSRAPSQLRDIIAGNYYHIFFNITVH